MSVLLIWLLCKFLGEFVLCHVFPTTGRELAGSLDELLLRNTFYGRRAREPDERLVVHATVEYVARNGACDSSVHVCDAATLRRIKNLFVGVVRPGHAGMVLSREVAARLGLKWVRRILVGKVIPNRALREVTAVDSTLRSKRN